MAAWKDKARPVLARDDRSRFGPVWLRNSNAFERENDLADSDFLTLLDVNLFDDSADSDPPQAVSPGFSMPAQLGK
jgi:hypothetical protein